MSSAVVWSYQMSSRPHLGVGRHLLAVAAHGRERGSPRFGRREAVAAGGDDDARGESLDVPFPRPGKRLVEVVRVEDERPFRRGEQAEVRDVRVAARLDRDVAARRGRQVERHHGRRAAVERERRRRHASVTQREQIRESVGLLGEDDRDRIPAGGELDRAVARCVAPPAEPPGRSAARSATGDPGTWRPGVGVAPGFCLGRPGGIQFSGGRDRRLPGPASVGGRSWGRHPRTVAGVKTMRPHARVVRARPPLGPRPR